MTIHINEIEFPGVEGVPALYFDNRAELEDASHESDSLEWSSRVLISLDGDGCEFHRVSIDAQQTSDLTVLRRAVSVLQQTLAELTETYGDQAPAGRCTHFGEWGRCTEREDHLPGEHDLPSEEQWEQEFNARLRGRKARAARKAQEIVDRSPILVVRRATIDARERNALELGVDAAPIMRRH